MLLILNSFILLSFFISLSFSCYFSKDGRHSTFLSLLQAGLSSMVNTPVSKLLFLSLFTFFLCSNFLGNIPLSSIPTLFYSASFTFSLLFWVALMGCVLWVQPVPFIAHMLPYGAPAGLMLFLPLVEIFSQLIRPLTLMIRLSTNLSAGHIMMYMFSYFTLLSSALSPVLYAVMTLLFFLEFFISLLQAYIFVSLLSLYVEETL